MNRDVLPSAIKYRYLILGVFGFLILISAWKIPSMRVHYNSLDYFPLKDDIVKKYLDYDRTFVTSRDYLLVAFEQDKDVFAPEFIEKLARFSQSVRKDSSVVKVTGIHNYQYWQNTPFGLIQKPVLSSSKPNTEIQKKRILQDPRTKKLLINDTGTATCVLVQTKKLITDASADVLIERIYSSASDASLPRPKLAGKLYTESSYVHQLEQENLRLTPLFILIVSIVLLLLYKSPMASLLPTLSVIAGLVMLYGYAAWIGRDVNIATLMFPTVMAVVGIADLIHLYTRYQEELYLGRDKIVAIRNSVRELRMALFLTSLTTMIGFVCISFSKIPYVHTFGIDAAVGVGVAFLIAILLTPVLLHYIPVRFVASRKLNWDVFLERVYTIGKDNSHRIMMAYIFLIVLALFGLTRINMNTTLLDAIGDNTILKHDSKYIEREFAGVRVLELVITMHNGRSITDFATIQALDKIETYLRSFPAVGYVISPTAYYKSLYDTHHGAPLTNYKIPSSQKSYTRNQKRKTSIDNPFVSTNKASGLMSVRMQDIGRLEMDRFVSEIEAWIRDNVDVSHFQVTPSGRHRLIDLSNELMVGSLFDGLLIAIVLISLIIFGLFRSIRVALISLIPNLLPLLMTAGTMGYMGVELNGSSAIIFTIAFVIAVDDTIHFLKKYSYIRENDEALGKEELIRRTLLQAGKAILVTSIILISGYSILMLSDFKEAYYHGVLISFTLIWAVLSDLFLLPILLRKYA